MARRKTSPGEEESGPGFEESLAEIEEIVEAMEHEQLPLEELVARFEKGSQLLDRCEKFLGSARKRIELITLRNTGGGDASDGSDDASPSPSDATDAPDDDDIRLF